ncbi:MAG: hypothetical protein K2R98_01035 [Gemmataceae bacterium]|nr:hypothetical protein [Gemmataceae bacterium]
MSCQVLGLDIGGANLKAVHAAGVTRTQPFHLWRAPSDLPDALRSLLREMPAHDHLAVTMTGELCDCFSTKREGVHVILDAVRAVAGSARVSVWRTDGRLVDLATARDAPLLVAAANWLALATFAGRWAPHGPALLLDIGSTTTDIIPLMNGEPAPSGRTDPERLNSGELVYTGVRRTPLCVLLPDRTAAELFATTLDAYLLLGQLPEAPGDTHTADGRPATRLAAHGRLARMLCADVETCSEAERLALARHAAIAQKSLICKSIDAVVHRMGHSPHTVIVAGSGEFLARDVASGMRWFPSARLVSLADMLGPDASTAACAHALAVLAAEMSVA